MGDFELFLQRLYEFDDLDVAFKDLAPDEVHVTSHLLCVPILLPLLTAGLCFNIHTDTGRCKSLLPYLIT